MSISVFSVAVFIALLNPAIEYEFFRAIAVPLSVMVVGIVVVEFIDHVIVGGKDHYRRNAILYR